MCQDRIFRPSKEQLDQCIGLVDKDYLVSTDECGFIKTGNDIDSNFKTVVLGDSFVESTFLDEADRFCSILERHDSRFGKFLGRVLNAGVSGSTSLNLFNCLLNKIIPIHPDLVIYVLPSNDASVHRYCETYWNDSEYYANIIPPSKTNLVGGFDSNIMSIDFIRIMSVFSHVCSVFGVKLAVATTVFETRYRGEFIEKKYKSKAWFDANISARRFLNDKLRSFAFINRIPLIDLEIAISGEDYLFYDDLHLNVKGSRLVADVLYDRVSAFLG